MTLYFNTRNTGSNNWDNPGNWFEDPDGNTSYNNTPSTGDDLYFQSNCNSNIPTSLDYYITIEAGVTLSLNGGGSYNNSGRYIYCYGALEIADTNTLFASDLNIFSGGNFNNYGIFSGTISNNTGTITNSNSFGGNITSNSGYISNGGDFACTIALNTGTIYNGNSFTGTITTNDTSGAINNNGTLSVSIGTNNGTINNNAGTFNGYNINNNGLINTNTTFNSNGIINNNSSGVITNSFVFNSNTAFTNDGTFNNVGGTFANNSTFTNNGITTIATGANLSLRPTSSFINNGTFTYGTKYTTRFRGEIFPQVPSSASWGNALL